MKQTFQFVIFLSCFVLSSSVGEEGKIPPLLVITDLRTVGPGTSEAEARVFTDFIRAEVEKSALFRTISRVSMMAILKAKSFPLPCHELPCFAEMGRLLGADQVLAGHLKRVGAVLEVTLRVIDVEKEEFISTAYRLASGLTTSEMQGVWGRQLLSEALRVDPKEFGVDEQSLTAASTAADDIPQAIADKYPGMVYIPSGWSIVGSNEGDPSESPEHRVYVESFYIGQYEVTNREYAEFIQATGHQAPPQWVQNQPPGDMLEHPVVWVSFADAEAFCLWAGGRLPTEAEWERAARGGKKIVYPWGNEFDPNLANTWESNRRGTAPVGSYSQGQSPFGVEDMAGNVFEWVDGFFEPYPGSKHYQPEYSQHLRILRGGSWNFNDYYARSTHRFARSGGETGRDYGFRLARDP